MAEVSLTKHSNFLSPADPAAEEYIGKMKQGQYLIAEIKRPRNPQFHKKFMSLLRLGFEYWEPGEVGNRWGKPEKNFDQFREDVTIMAGFFTVSIRTDGSTRLRPKSISFASMDDEEFERVYQSVLTVLMERVLTGLSEDEVESITNQLMSYA